MSVGGHCGGLADAADAIRAKNRKSLVLILGLILSFNYVDRFALGLLLQDIKTDLDLSDTQLGVMTGIAFALFYSVLGIPIARWADRGNRVHIVALTTAVWSAAVAMCALAGNFFYLLLIRIGVAVGEAGCVPPAHSLIGDHYERSERPRAIARYMLGGSLSVVVGYFAAGWLNELYGWRLTFAILGTPGLLLALTAILVLEEPRKRRRPGGETVSGDVPLSAAWAFFGSSATFRHLLIAFAVMAFFSTGIQQWKPAFFIRSFGMSTGELGTWLTLASGLGGALGVWFGGELASRVRHATESRQLRLIAMLYCAYAIVQSFIYLASDRVTALVLLAIVSIGNAMASAPLFAIIQSLVPDRMRATAIALLYLFANLIGLGLGPLVAGMLSDALSARFGAESLRYSLLCFSPGYLWGAWHMFRASQTVDRELAGARDRDPAAVGLDGDAR